MLKQRIMMKSLVKIFTAALFMLTIAGCDRKSCNDVVCDYGQNCFQGQCYCPDGYEGTDCLTQSNTKFVGSYQVSENCYNGGSNFGSYNCYISQGSSGYAYQLEITNLFGLTYATANIRTDQNNQGNLIEIPYQNQGGISLQGEGVYDTYNNRMTIDFNYTFNGSSYQCTHTFYKF